jgi:hypothetical protein
LLMVKRAFNFLREIVIIGFVFVSFGFIFPLSLVTTNFRWVNRSYILL